MQTKDLRVAACNDLKCTGANEVISVVDDSGTVGRYVSVRRGVGGKPVIAYEGAQRLKFAACNDTACAGGNEAISVLDPTIGSGQWASAAIGLDGAPLVAYRSGADESVQFVWACC
jgi:hypothetical protein